MASVRKYGRNKKKCSVYSAEHRREKNKRRRVERLAKRLSRSGKEYRLVLGPNGRGFNIERVL